jgi:hypothetical protein
MPGVDFNQKLFQASASAVTDWGSAEGNTESDFTAGATVKRCYDLEVAISALAEVDAAFAKFIAAQVTATASAEARLAVQVQLPLNLFDEAGAAVRVKAVAEAAAGIQAGLGLTIGDFVELAQQIIGDQGVSIRLLILFLDEVDLTAGVYAKVSASAQAQAYATIVGTLVENSARGTKPGFNIVAGAGLGLAAGAGVRLFARAGLRDFARFYANAVDLVVDGVFNEVFLRLGSVAGAELTAALDVARPLFKIAFRLGYDVGDFIAKSQPPQNADGAAALTARAVAVVFEESQRYLLRNFIVAGIRQLQAALAPRIAALDSAGEARIKPTRDTLVALLRSRPENLFDVSDPATQQFWIDAIADILNLVSKIFAGTNPSPDVVRAMTATWCAMQLMIVATKRATRADASVSVVGLPPQQTQTPFTGSPTAQPPAPISDELAAKLGITTPTGGWGLEHAVSYLVTAGSVDLLETVVPECKPYLDKFQGLFGATSTEVAAKILKNIGAVPDSTGTIDPQQTLTNLLSILHDLIDNVVDAQAMPVARTALAASPDALLYLNEVLRPGLDFALNTCADLLLNWASGSVGQSAATEALSGIILKLLGRTLVVTSDVLQNYTQQQTQGILESVAATVHSNGIAEKFAELSHLPVDVAADRIADFLRLVGRTLAPYTEDERNEIRSLCFTVLDPVPPAGGPNFVDQLASDSFVPNAEAAVQLAQRTFDLLSERFVAFALGTLDLFGSSFLKVIEDALQAACDAVREWMAEAGQALAAAEQRLAEIGLEILAAADAAAKAMNDALGELASAFAAIGDASRRSALKNNLGDAFVDKLSAVLDQNPVYRAIPADLRQDARDSARSLARAAANDLASPVFDAIASVASNVSDMLDDIRQLPPSTALASGVTEIILDHIETLIRASFNGGDPGFNIGFNFTYSLPEVELLPPEVVMRSHTVHVNLGRIELPIPSFAGIVRQVLTATAGFELAIEQAAGNLRSWLEKELEAAAKTKEQNDVKTSADALRAEGAAVTGAPKDVSIASPANAGVYSDIVPVRIVLDDATAEFVDFTQGPARFFVHLNGVELATVRFAIETRPAPADKLNSVIAGAAFFGSLAQASQVRLGGSAAGKPVVQARTIKSRAPAPASASLGLHPLASPWSADAVIGNRAAAQSPTSLISAFDPGTRIRGIRLAGLPQSGGFKLSAGGALGKPLLVKPGAHLNDIDIAHVLEESPRTSITFGAQLNLNECHAGPNAISVTVIASDGSKLTRTATFIAEAPAKVTPPKDGEEGRPVVFPPRQTPVDPAHLRPKPKHPVLGVAQQKTLADAATKAVTERKNSAGAKLGAASAVLQRRLAALRGTTSDPGDRSLWNEKAT